MTERRRGLSVPTVLIVILAVAVVAVGGWLSLSWLQRTPSAAGSTQAAGAGAASGLTEQTRAAILDSARVYLTKNEPGKAEAVLSQAVREHPGAQDFRVALAETFLMLRRFEEAYAQYEAALSIGPRDAGLEFAAGTVAARIGRSDRAVEHYSAASSKEKTNAQYALFLGQVQLNLGQTEAGKASILRAANLDPRSAIAWGTLADVALRENAINLSLQHIAKARELEPTVATWRIIEARALKRQGEPEKALRVLTALSVAERREPATLRQIAECFGMLKRPGDAAAAYAEASDAKPDEAELAFEAALWHQRAGQEERARTFAQRAAGLGHPGAQKMLAGVAGDR